MPADRLGDDRPAGPRTGATRFTTAASARRHSGAPWAVTRSKPPGSTGPRGCRPGEAQAGYVCTGQNRSRSTATARPLGPPARPTRPTWSRCHSQPQRDRQPHHQRGRLLLRESAFVRWASVAVLGARYPVGELPLQARARAESGWRERRRAGQCGRGQGERDRAGAGHGPAHPWWRRIGRSRLGRPRQWLFPGQRWRR
jgi:hypothetical protein